MKQTIKSTRKKVPYSEKDIAFSLSMWPSRPIDPVLRGLVNKARELKK